MADRSPRVRGIVVDVDGTLTDADRHLDLRAIRAIQALDRRGVPVVLATGNVLPIALAIWRFVGLHAPIVAENGGLLYDRVDRQDQLLRLASRPIALRAFRRLKKAGLDPRPLFTDRWRETEVALEASLDVDKARRVLAHHPVEVVPTGYAVHLIEKGHGKLPALSRALHRFGLSPSDCLIAGDGENDVPMLHAAGWAVSFRDADPLARAAAAYIARGRNASGLVEALKRVHAVPPSATG